MEPNMEKQYSVKEVIEIVIDTLNRISVPISLSQQIAMPLTNSVGYLQQCVDVLARDEFEQKMREEAAKQAEMEIPEAETTEMIEPNAPDEVHSEEAGAEENP